MYGTGDAGRRFYKSFRDKALGAGLVENCIMKSLYSYSLNGEIKVILAAHVDDLLYTSDPDCSYIIDDLLKRFEVKETK